MSYQIKSFANFLLLFSFVGFIFIFGPILSAETHYQWKKITGGSFNLSPRPLDYDFDIVIPKIEVNSKVFKNTNPANYQEYMPVLRKGVAHAKGTGLPGDKDKKNIFLFGHSSVFFWEAGQINPTFYLLSKLEEGDLITLYYQGGRYDYRVLEKKIIGPKEVTDINKPGNEGSLILQTCWPPGTNFKRLLIFAR